MTNKELIKNCILRRHYCRGCSSKADCDIFQSIYHVTPAGAKRLLGERVRRVAIIEELLDADWLKKEASENDKPRVD